MTDYARLLARLDADRYQIRDGRIREASDALRELIADNERLCESVVNCHREIYARDATIKRLEESLKKVLTPQAACDILSPQ